MCPSNDRISNLNPRRLLVALCLLILCTPALGAKRVTFINPGFEAEGFWMKVSATMQAAADSLGFELEILYADRQWPKMVENGTRVLARAELPDYLILVNEHQQVPALLKLAEQRGVKTLLLLNSLTPEQTQTLGQPRQALSHWLGSLTPDNEIAGYQIATSVIDTATQLGLAREGQVHLLALAGDFKTPASLGRLAGLQRALEDRPNALLERRFTVNWSHDKAYRQTQLWLQSQGELDAVWAANDPIALGAIKALREAGRTPGKDVSVAGLNWSPEALQLVKSGAMTLTHGGHFLAGAWSLVLLYDYDQGLDFVTPDSGASSGAEIHFPMTAIDQTNVQAYLNALGDGDWSKIDFKQFSRQQQPQRPGYDFSMAALLQAAAD
ncbi:MAG: ABC-type sugar transport system substrate-binding protein [Motiliproteus sp.]|jgi:ABC-type sugar transport system substrate-binding protein